MVLLSIDPTHGELIESFDEIGDADLEAALARAQHTFRAYRLGCHGIREFVNVKAVSITEHPEGRGSDAE